MSRLFHVLLVLLICFVDFRAVAEEAEAAADAGADETALVDDETLADDDLVVIDLDEEVHEEEEIAVDDYLATLSVDELKKICWDRGFDVEEEGGALTHGDYVEAARRCLSLEDEMNAILNEHPELAAELEKEIQRLQQHKVRLEQEQEDMLKEKALLEAQLEQAGVDLDNFRAKYEHGSGAFPAAGGKDLSEMSFPELFVETMRQLYDRVKQDVVFVVKVTRPAWEKAREVLQFGWRYSKPFVMQAYAEVQKRTKRFLAGASGGNEMAETA